MEIELNCIPGKRGESERLEQAIAYFTVVYSVPWPLNRRQAGGDLVLLQPSRFLLTARLLILIKAMLMESFFLT